MAASYNPNQQAYQRQGQADHPPDLQADSAYGYPPQDQGASAQYPSPQVEDYPPQGYPPQVQADSPPPYPTHEPVSPPAYNSKADQLAYNFQPQPTNTSAVVVAAQEPVAARPTMWAISNHVSPPERDQSGAAVCALVFSIITLITCGATLICLSLSIPALILSIKALGMRGNLQNRKVCISIVLNVAVVVCTVVLLVVVVTPATVTTGAASRYRYCPSYYSSSYSTHCEPYSYTTLGSCSYYVSYSGYCPSTYTYQCPDYYSDAYSSYCTDSGFFSRTFCRYKSTERRGFCRSRHPCPSYYMSSYSSYCVSSVSSTNRRCSYTGYSSGNGYCPT